MSDKENKNEAISEEVKDDAAKQPGAAGSPIEAVNAGFFKQNVSYIKMALYIILLNLTLTLSSIVAYDHYFATKIAVVDIDAFRKQQKQLFFSGKINQDTLLNSLEEYKTAIDSVGPNTILLYANGVCKNGKVIDIKR